MIDRIKPIRFTAATLPAAALSPALREPAEKAARVGTRTIAYLTSLQTYKSGRHEGQILAEDPRVQRLPSIRFIFPI